MEELENVESIRPKHEIKGWLTIADVVFVVSVTLTSYLIRGLVYPMFEYPFVAFTCLNAFLFVKPPKGNPGLKNYNVLWLVFRRYFFKEYGLYRAIDVREFVEE